MSSIDDIVDTEEESDELAAVAETKVLGGDEDFWARVGIDPVRMMTRSGNFFTLRCYLDDQPIFLGRNGRISVFPSERALARYLADEHDHDLSDLATYDDIRTAATDGSLRVDVTDDNVYVLTDIVDDLAEGPDALDRDQLELAVELLQRHRRLLRRHQRGRQARHRRAAGTADRLRARTRLRQPAERALRRRRRAVGVAGDVRGVPPARGVSAARARACAKCRHCGVSAYKHASSRETEQS